MAAGRGWVGRVGGEVTDQGPVPEAHCCCPRPPNPAHPPPRGRCAPSRAYSPIRPLPPGAGAVPPPLHAQPPWTPKAWRPRAAWPRPPPGTLVSLQGWNDGWMGALKCGGLGRLGWSGPRGVQATQPSRRARPRAHQPRPPFPAPPFPPLPGAIIRASFAKGESAKGVSAKANANDLVTETDVAAEGVILAAVRSAFPSHGFVGEEGAAAGTCGNEGDPGMPTWYVDPLDGTTNFVHSWPMVCVSIGLALGEEARQRNGVGMP